MKKKKKNRDYPSVMKWKGLLGDTQNQVRVVVLVAIIITIVTQTFTQVGFVGIGFNRMYVAYAILLLAPVALTASFFGVLKGTLMGLFAGTVLAIHSVMQPMNYYELYLVSPLFMVLAFTFIGFLTGIFMSLALRKNPQGAKRYVRIILVTLFMSAVFSLMFFLSVLVQLVVNLASILAEDPTFIESGGLAQSSVALIASKLGDPFIQVGVDALIMAACVIIGDLIMNALSKRKGSYGVRVTFRAWLIVVSILVFMVSLVVGFTVITEQQKNAAAEKMKDESSYIVTQIEKGDASIESFNTILDRTNYQGGDPDVDKAIDVASEKLSYLGLLDGYSTDIDGLVIISEDNTIRLSDDPKVDVDMSLYDALGPEAERGIEESINTGNVCQSLINLLYREKDKGEFSYTADLSLIYAQKIDNVKVIIMQDFRMVFAQRAGIVAWISLSALVLLIAIYILVSRLLDILVVRKINETNKVLSKIASGDLDESVNVTGSVEFESLSSDINITVSALKGWIAEAKSHMDSELATAKAIQASALPQTFPPYPDIRKFDIFASMNPAKEVGGDFYDFFLINEEEEDSKKLGFVLADVSGKGVPAALFMMKAKTQIRDYMMAGMDIGEAFENANRQLCDGNDTGMFVTVFAGILNYETGEVSFVNAGHNPPLLWQIKEWKYLEEKSGMPLGLFDEFPYESFNLKLQIGDQFFIYTDGVTEAMDVEDHLYGEDRLKKVLDENYSCHPVELNRIVQQDVASFAEGAEQSDDITILGLEYGVPPVLTTSIHIPAQQKELVTVNDFLHQELTRRLCPLRAQNQLDIAVEEIFVNIARYAYPDATPDNPGMVRVSYTYFADPPTFTVEIADSGIPYNPLEKPDAVTPDDIMEVPIGGLGILMAKNSVDEMKYEYVDGFNVVTLVKKW